MTPTKLRRMAIFLDYFAFMLRKWAEEMEAKKNGGSRRN